MQSQRTRGLLWILGPIGGISLVLAWLLGQSMWIAVGVVAFGGVGLRYHAPLGNACRWLTARFRKPEPDRLAKPEPVDPQDTDGLIAQMLDQGRYTLLLRPQIAEYLDIPKEIIGRTPTTDTYPAQQTQEEFFYQLPVRLMDLYWYAFEKGYEPVEVAAAMNETPERIESLFSNFRRKRKTTDYLRMAPVRDYFGV
jgi:hypothetical protein